MKRRLTTHYYMKKRRPVLEKAVAAFLAKGKTPAYEKFVEEKAEWLEPFAEYMAIKESFGMKPWTAWSDEAIKRRQPDALAEYRTRLADKLEYHRVTQFLFDEQWHALKKYANDHFIQIIGDMPIYVAADSVEMWATPHYFKTDEEGNPLCVAGCPADDFSPLGQLWGNPIYNWEAMKEDGYTWWSKRLQASFELFDVVRIDHFRGFSAYWEIPAEAENATIGKWVKGPGYDLFKAVKEQLGELPIIAEDLGFMDEDVINLREATGFPGMKILEFGFMGEDPKSGDLPHHYPVNAVAYTGTHDNDTVLGWYKSATEETREFCNRYLNRRDEEPISFALLRGLYGSVSRMTVATMQDLLQLDETARMNIPSTLGGNWVWRMKEEQLTESVEEFLLGITELYDRANPHHNVDVKEELVEEEKITSRTLKKERTMKDFKQYVEGNIGKSLKDCSKEEVYLALLQFTKEKSAALPQNNGKKKVYYISAEFLIGKLLSNNLINLGLYDEVKEELEAAGHSLAEIEEIELEPSLGNGGLGRLAACFLDSIATLGLTGDGVGLNYHYGLFEQKFKDNQQDAVPNVWLTPESWLVPTETSYKVPFADFTLTSKNV